MSFASMTDLPGHGTSSLVPPRTQFSVELFDTQISRDVSAKSLHVVILTALCKVTERLKRKVRANRGKMHWHAHLHLGWGL
jgi:hypothetical protein